MQWPSCNGRTKNAVSMSIWVCTRPHYFYCPTPDFTTSIVSQSVTNNRCAPSCGGTREKWGGTSKKFRPALRAGILPPLANCFRRHWKELVLTRRIESKRARGRQRLTFLGWLHRTTGVKPLELIAMLKDRRQQEAVTAVYSRALAWHAEWIEGRSGLIFFENTTNAMIK